MNACQRKYGNVFYLYVSVVLQNILAETTVYLNCIGLFWNPKNLLKTSGNDYLAVLLTFGDVYRITFPAVKQKQ